MAIETFSPIEIPFPIYKTQPELICVPAPIRMSPTPPAALNFTKESIQTFGPIKSLSP